MASGVNPELVDSVVAFIERQMTQNYLPPTSREIAAGLSIALESVTRAIAVAVADGRLMDLSPDGKVSARKYVSARLWTMATLAMGMDMIDTEEK